MIFDRIFLGRIESIMDTIRDKWETIKGNNLYLMLLIVDLIFLALIVTLIVKRKGKRKARRMRPAARVPAVQASAAAPAHATSRAVSASAPQAISVSGAHECPTCGTLNVAKAAFCAKCGNRLTEPTPVATARAPAPVTAAPTPAPQPRQISFGAETSGAEAPGATKPVAAPQPPRASGGGSGWGGSGTVDFSLERQPEPTSSVQPSAAQETYSAATEEALPAPLDQSQTQSLLSNKARILDQIKQLDEQHRSGQLSDMNYSMAKMTLTKKLKKIENVLKWA